MKKFDLDRGGRIMLFNTFLFISVRRNFPNPMVTYLLIPVAEKKKQNVGL